VTFPFEGLSVTLHSQHDDVTGAHGEAKRTGESFHCGGFSGIRRPARAQPMAGTIPPIFIDGCADPRQGAFPKGRCSKLLQMIGRQNRSAIPSDSVSTRLMWRRRHRWISIFEFPSSGDLALAQLA